jgi:hypothetical protein
MRERRSFNQVFPVFSVLAMRSRRSFCAIDSQIGMFE